jgi:hypothetical protein
MLTSPHNFLQEAPVAHSSVVCLEEGLINDLVNVDPVTQGSCYLTRPVGRVPQLTSTTMLSIEGYEGYDIVSETTPLLPEGNKKPKSGRCQCSANLVSVGSNE